MLSTVTDKKLLFARPPVLGAAWVRENWLLGSPGTPKHWESGAVMSTCPQSSALARSAGFIRNVKRPVIKAQETFRASPFQGISSHFPTAFVFDVAPVQ